ncbi:SPOR domain-containing protein [Pseudothauera lacus]|uniref:SPOR domain-containing protein n=1 Tax=Pseudothauera lacus TaxID=2136175 RepID=A0A2T4II45_9RHOO|nr:SPOR domain-containing protein [Pseudothauera lacus]PTD97443.1 SPOR domain-containing protein [Pseudothauera lacus]
MDTDNLELQKRSRRRLVGAAALALLAAIVLPMVMDEEPLSPVQDIQITIPERDGELSRPIGGRAPQAAEAEIAPPPQEAAPPAAERAAVTPAAPPVAAVAPAPVVITPPTPGSSPPAPPAPAAAQAPRPAQPAPATPPEDESARVRAILEGRVAAPVSSSGSYVVQIAAFGDPANAEALAADLKKKGFVAYTEKAGNVTRVRVGPFTARGEADAAAGRLRELGQNPVVTAR